VVFRAVVFKLLVWCGAEGYVSGLQDAESHQIYIWFILVEKLVTFGHVVGRFYATEI